jgi:eukaryotic-like serine/threonine-protein kinase
MREFPSEESIFEELLACSNEEQRNTILKDRCGQDAEFRDRMHALLTSYFQSDCLEKSSTFASYLLNLPSQLKGKRVGSFEVLEGIGEGGMGDVYLGRAVEPPFELVAIKVIKPGMDTRQVLSRFELERRTLQQLSHPNIARFVASGMAESGSAFFAMELVRGSPITEFCNRHRLSMTERLKIFVTLCRAVAHANEQNIVHRDLKPSNVLVGRVNGAPTVKVIDFGVAKALATDFDISSRFTGATQWIGTAQYMSLEQSQCSSDVDCRTDVYSLGCILYELICNSTPLDITKSKALDLVSLRTAIVTNVPKLPSRKLKSIAKTDLDAIAIERSTTPSKLVRDVSGKLDWIVSKAIAADRTQRYSTAELLACDVDAFLSGAAVSAKSLTKFYSRFGNAPLKKRSVVLGLVGCFIATTLVAYLMINRDSISWIVRDPTLKASKTTSREVDANAIHETYRLLTEAAMAIEGGVPEQAKVLIDEIGGLSPSLPKKTFIASYLRGRIPQILREFSTRAGQLIFADRSADCRLLAMGSFDGEVIVWDYETAAIKYQFRPSKIEITRVAFSPDSKTLAAAGQGSTIWLWNMRDGELLGSMSNHIGTISNIGWSPDGKILVSGDRHGQVSLWDASTRECIRVLQERQPIDTAIRYIHWLPDGRTLAILQGNLGLLLWDTATWTSKLYPQGSESLNIAVSPNNRYLAFGGYGDGLNVIDLHDSNDQTRVTTSVLSKFGVTTSLVFTSDHRVVRGTSSGFVEAFDYSNETSNWESIGRINLEGATSGIFRMEYSKDDDTMLLAIGEPSACRLYSAKNFAAYVAHDNGMRLLGTIRQLGRSLWWDDLSQQIRIEDSIDRRGIATLQLRPVLNCPITYAEKNGVVAIAIHGDRGPNDASNSAVLLRADDWTEIASFECTEPISNLSFSPEADLLAAGCERGLTRVWNIASGSFRDWRLSEENRTFRAVFSPVQPVLAVGEIGSDTIRTLDCKSFEEIANINLQIPWVSFEFNEAGRLLFLGDKRFTCFDPFLNQVEWVAPYRSQNSTLANLAFAFTPDYRSFVKFDNESVDIWDLETHKTIMSISVPNQYPAASTQRMVSRFQINFSNSQKMLIRDCESNTLLELSGK